jgi:hypothetical protein
MERAVTTEHSEEPNPFDSTGLCLLSLDGGGGRGLINLVSFTKRLHHNPHRMLIYKFYATIR